MRCVPARDFTIAKALAWRSSIEIDPPYQREGSIWSIDKQQLFIDSLLNGYDVPKIYLHDLRGKRPSKVYAVVDGKQRLGTIWQFLGGEFGLASDFRIEPGNLPDLPAGVRHPGPGDHFAQLDPAWQRVLTSTYLAVVLIQNATETDIEDLFARLNNGEPLNAAEKRNAIGGELARTIREVARHPFFGDRLRFGNGRFQHLDLAARLVRIELLEWTPGQPVPDLRNPALELDAKSHRRVPAARRAELETRLDRHLDVLSRVFEHHDPLLASGPDAVLYSLFCRTVEDAARRSPSSVRDALARFHTERRAALDQPDAVHDVAVSEYSHLVHSGPLEPRSLERRLAILVQRFASEAGLDSPAGLDSAEPSAG